MKLSKLVVLCFLSVFAFSSFADDSDFNDEPSASPAAPPSASGDYNKELMDATHKDEPKVPEPESKPPATEPAPAAPAAPKHSSHKKPKKKPATKSAKKSAKGKKGAKKKKHKKNHAAE